MASPMVDERGSPPASNKAFLPAKNEGFSSLLSGVAGSLAKLVASTLGLVFLTVALAYLLIEYEAPQEKLLLEDESRHRARAHQMISEVFGFHDIPEDRGLTGFTNCAEAYEEFAIPDDTIGGVLMDAGDFIYPDAAPADSKDRAEQWIDATDRHTRCERNADGSPATKNADGSFDGCILRCALKQPNPGDVRACRNLGHGSNPASFNDNCLISSASCPNCNMLRKKITDLAFHAPSNASAAGDHVLQLAEVYETYASKVETSMPTQNWTWEGSLFFAFTVLTTVGYGSFAPEYDASKLAITVLIVPGIVAFGYALANFASVVMAIVSFIQTKMGLKSNRQSVSNEPKVWEATLRRCDKSRDGTLTLEELLQGADQILKVMGFEGSDRKSAKALAKAKAFITKAFAAADDDSSGDLTIGEGMTMIGDLVRSAQAEMNEIEARETLVGSVLAFFIVLVISAFTFISLEESDDVEYTVLDSFYFMMVSFSTLGLGDITPSYGSSMYAWYAYTLLGLGVLAVVITAAGDIVEAHAARLAILTRRIDASHSGDKKKVVPVKGDVESR